MTGGENMFPDLKNSIEKYSKKLEELKDYLWRRRKKKKTFRNWKFNSSKGFLELSWKNSWNSQRTPKTFGRYRKSEKAWRGYRRKLYSSWSCSWGIWFGNYWWGSPAAWKNWCKDKTVFYRCYFKQWWR